MRFWYVGSSPNHNQAITKAKIGEVLGVLSISEEMPGFRSSFLPEFVMIFLIFLPIPILMSLAVSKYVNSHLGDAVGKLDRMIRSVNSMADLTKFEAELESEEHRFRELEDIFSEFTKFVGRIKGLAVGKEMLSKEFLIHLPNNS